MNLVLRVASSLPGLQRSQWWPAHRIRQSQELAIGAQLRHALRHVPFYRDLGIDPGAITGLDQLERFPLLTKRQIQVDPRRLIADGHRPDPVRSSFTSGSSGEPMTTYFDADSWALCRYGLKLRRILAYTMPVARRSVTVTLQPPERVRAHSSQRPMRSFGLLREEFVSVFEDIERQRSTFEYAHPHFVHGPPSQLIELARHCERIGRPVPAVPLIFTSSELLTPAVRLAIEAKYGARVVDIYGSTEFKEVAWQCPNGRYHLNFESVFVETLSDDDGSSRLVLTSLCNRAMPLIRYDIGDLGDLEWGPCPCGRKSPALARLQGRRVDILVLPSGRRISQYVLEGYLEALPGLTRYQIVERGGAELEILYVAAQDLAGPSMDQCRRQLAEHFQEPVRLRFTRVDHIARTPGGKHRVMVKAA